MPTVLITGASRGIGLELARQYASDGWSVIATARDAAGAETLARLGPQVSVGIADVTDRAAIARLASGLKGAAIDVLLCNAAVYSSRSTGLGHVDYGAWEQTLRVNLLGPFAVVEALVDNVAASKRRIIAMMSSRLGSIADSRGGEYVYSSSKAALNAVAKGLSIDLAKRRITVVALTPGWVRTDMGGSGAPLNVETSVRGLRRVLDGLSPKLSGRFFRYDGTEVPW